MGAGHHSKYGVLFPLQTFHRGTCLTTAKSGVLAKSGTYQGMRQRLSICRHVWPEYELHTTLTQIFVISCILSGSSDSKTIVGFLPTPSFLLLEIEQC